LGCMEFNMQLSGWLPAILFLIIGTAIELVGDLRGGYGWCDIVFIAFVVVAAMFAWQALWSSVRSAAERGARR